MTAAAAPMPLLRTTREDGTTTPAAPAVVAAGLAHPCDRWEVARTVGELSTLPVAIPCRVPGASDRALSALGRALCGWDAPRLPRLLSRWRALNPPGAPHAKFRA